MNGPKHKMTIHQERLAYARAVTLCLERFFDKSAAESHEIVTAWWDRMGTGEVFRSGIFMHDEPINTAADLAGGLPAPAIREISARYLAVIAEAMPKPRKKSNPTPKRANAMAHAA
jgi:hypothetical protein